jgi:hypothetical protein
MARRLKTMAVRSLQSEVLAPKASFLGKALAPPDDAFDQSYLNPTYH